MRSCLHLAGWLLLAVVTAAVIPAAPATAADVNLAIGSLPSQRSVTIELEVRIDDPVAPLATTHAVCNQGSVSGSNFVTIATDDLETPAAGDSTCTSLPELGDAPAPYPTLLVNDGARHGLRPGLLLGATADAEADGQPSAAANGDDADGNNDDDGVSFALAEGALPAVLPGASNTVDIVVTGGGCALNAWLDLNADGDWNDTGEQIFTDQALVAGANNGLSFAVPASAVIGTTFARFRCSSATGLLPTGAAVDGEVEDYQVLIATSSIATTKTALPDSVPEPGAAVSFTVRVDNTGNTTVSLTSLADDLLGNLDGQGSCSLPQSIAVGGFYECSLSATVNGNAGDSVTNTVTAAGSGVAGPVMASDSATVMITDVLPSISLSKSAAPSSLPEPGASVTFTARVDNLSSAEAVSLSALVDDLHGDLNGQGSCSLPQTINAGGFYQCSFSATVNGNAGDSETDTITATAADDEANPAQAQGSATVIITDVLPTISVTKTAAPTSIDEPGGSVSFTVRVDNTGTAEAVTLTGLDDDLHGSLDGQGSCSLPQTISAASFYECSLTVTVNGNAGDSETDTVTATAADDESNPVQAQDSATVSITGIDLGDAPAPYPSMLAADGARHTLGSGLFLGSLVDAEPDAQPDATATGDDLARLDDEDGASFGVLVPGTTGTVDLVASGAGTLNAWIDFNADGDWDDAGEQIFTDQALAAGANPGLGFPVPAGASFGPTVARLRLSTDTGLLATGLASDGEVEDHQVTIGLTAITVSKTATPDSLPEPGGTVSFTVRINNTGSDAAELTGLVDSVFGDLDGQGSCSLPQTVASGGFYECSFSGPVSGDAGTVHSNTVTATATSIAGPGSDTGSATVTITDVAPTIAVTKTATPATIEQPGGTITFTVRVDSTGTAEAVSLSSLVDDVHGDLDGQGSCAVPQTVAAGSFSECSFTATVSGVAGDSETDTVTALANDNEGNLVSAQGSATVTIIDPTPPTVTAVSTLPGASLDECEQVTDDFTRIDVSFNEDLANPTDAGGYLLVGTGPDQDLSTLSCTAAGDDQPIAFTAITVGGSPGAPTVSLAVPPRSPGIYRLLVCDTLTDTDGNALDGDGNGSAGGQLLRTFRNDPANRLVNGSFDDCPMSLGGWTIFRTAPDAILPSLADRHGSPLSGSVEIISSSGLEAGISQCVAVAAEATADLRVSVQLTGNVAGALTTLVRSCSFSPLPGCAGGQLSGINLVSVIGDTGGGWLDLSAVITSPAGAASADCSFSLVPATGASFNALLDELYLGGEAAVPIFSDGFESGGTAAWSATVPAAIADQLIPEGAH